MASEAETGNQRPTTRRHMAKLVSPGNPSQLLSHEWHLWSGITVRGNILKRGAGPRLCLLAYSCQSLPHIVGLCKWTALGWFSCPNIWGFIWDQKWWKALLSAGAQSICSRCQSWHDPCHGRDYAGAWLRYPALLEDEETTAVMARALYLTNSQEPGKRRGWANTERKINQDQP